MPYARFDDLYDDHRKIKRAWRQEPAAVALHAMAITYCNRHITDGIVELDWLEEKLALLPYPPQRRGKVLEVLVALKLLEPIDPERFLVHDFLDWNLSREQRELLRDQGRRGGQARARNTAQLTLAGDPQPDDITPGTPPAMNGRRDRRELEQRLFDEWLAATGRTDRTVLDDKRRRAIRNGIKIVEHSGGKLTEDDLLAAVRGVRHSQHHMSNPQWSELRVVLRDAGQIETFRDLEHKPPATATAASSSDRFGEYDKAAGL